MAQENVETLRRTYAAWRAGRPTEALDCIDPDVVWTALDDAPDAGTYRGHAGVLGYMGDWLRDFEDLDVEFEELVEAEDRVVAVQRGRGRGRSSGVEVDIRYAALYEFRDGRIARVREYRSRDQALEAAGLSR